MLDIFSSHTHKHQHAMIYTKNTHTSLLLLPYGPQSKKEQTIFKFTSKNDGMQNITSYQIPEEHLPEAQAIHTLVLHYHDNFFTDETIRNFLLHSWHEEEPHSFEDIRTMVHNREVTNLCRIVVKYGITLATTPELVGIEYHLDGSRKATMRGYSADKLEQLQREWFEQPDLVAAVRTYESDLGRAFDEFNLQFVFTKADAVRKYFPKSKEEEKIFREVTKTFSNELHPIMDSAYYDAAMILFSQCALSYERLSKLENGRLFLLTPEEVLNELNRRG